VALPGADGIQHTYNYCITSIVPLMAAPTAPSSLTTYGATFNEGKQIVLEGLGAYGVQNDPFNVGQDQMSMTASYGGGKVGFTATPMFNSGGSTPGAFPAIVSGWVTGGAFISRASGGYTGGKSIGALTSVKSDWTWTAGSGNWDAAYDTWFAANPDPVNATTELMVWVGHNGVTPLNGNGTFTPNFSNLPGGVAAPPGTWMGFLGTNNTNQPVVTYESTANINPVTGLDLRPFFLEAANNGRGGLSTGTNLLSVQAGFELYSQGTWTTNSYDIVIQ
jgi:hypothetical protein